MMVAERNLVNHLRHVHNQNLANKVVEKAIHLDLDLVANQLLVRATNLDHRPKVDVNHLHKMLVKTTNHQQINPDHRPKAENAINLNHLVKADLDRVVNKLVVKVTNLDHRPKAEVKVHENDHDHRVKVINKMAERIVNHQKNNQLAVERRKHLLKINLDDRHRVHQVNPEIVNKDNDEVHLAIVSENKIPIIIHHSSLDKSPSPAKKARKSAGGSSKKAKK